jgi:hypothetical protein
VKPKWLEEDQVQDRIIADGEKEGWRRNNGKDSFILILVPFNFTPLMIMKTLGWKIILANTWTAQDLIIHLRVRLLVASSDDFIPCPCQACRTCIRLPSLAVLITCLREFRDWLTFTMLGKLCCASV